MKNGKQIAQTLHQSLRYEKELLAQKIEAIESFPLALVAEAFLEGKWEMEYLGPSFLLPYNFEYIPLIKDFMKDQFPGVEFRREFPIIWEQHSQAAYYLVYSWGRFDLQFRLDSSRAGTTCVLNKIGEQTKIVPIYEVTCTEEKW